MRDFFGIEVDRKRVFGLDFLRAFAIFCVVQGHAERILFDTPLDRFTDMPVPHGVDIFFVISGFLIGKSFINYLEKHDNRISRSKTLNFYARTTLKRSRYGALPPSPKTCSPLSGAFIGSRIPYPYNGGSTSFFHFC